MRRWSKKHLLLDRHNKIRELYGGGGAVLGDSLKNNKCTTWEKAFVYQQHSESQWQGSLKKNIPIPNKEGAQKFATNVFFLSGQVFSLLFPLNSLLLQIPGTWKEKVGMRIKKESRSDHTPHLCPFGSLLKLKINKLSRGEEFNVTEERDNI